MTSDSGTHASAQKVWPRSVQFILTIVIATVLGPLIAAVTIFPFGAFNEITKSGFNLGDIAAYFIFIVSFSYIGGALIAFAAGLIVAIWSIWRQPTYVAVVVANLGFFGAAVDLSYKTFKAPFLEFLACSLFSATICWLLFRRFLRNPHILESPRNYPINVC